LWAAGRDDAVWNPAVFSKNRDQSLTSDVTKRFFAEVYKQAKKFMSDEHFTGRRHAKPDLGLAKELSLQGWLRR
jgi:hypothetical protein